MCFNYYAYLYFIPNKKIMKTRRTKFLLSFLAVAILWFAMVNAYTFEVTNRDPFGTLNLSTLMIKPDVNSNDTILLSGKTLRIKTDQGKLKVHKICNELEWSAEECIEFGNLWNWWPGEWGITATWSLNEYCYLKDSDGNLRCDNTALNTAIETVIGILGLTRPNNATITIKQWDYEKSFTLDQSNNDTIVLPWWDWDTIISGALVTQTGANTGYYCSSTDGETLICNNAITPGGSWVSASWTTWYYCKLTDDWNLKCDWNSSNWIGWWDSEWALDEIPQIWADWVQMGILHPKQYAYNVWIWVNAETLKAGWAKNYKLRVANWKTQIDWDVEIKPNESVPANFDGRWVRFFNAMALLMTRYTAEFEDDGITIKSKIPVGTVTWFTVNWPIAAWNPSNYIYMYADGNAGDADRHYEIMGNNELAIWTQYWAFLYFTQKTWNYVYHLEPLMYWNATTYWWWWEGCEAPKPDTPETPGVISPKSSCSATNNVQTAMAQPLGFGDYVDAYKTFMVWVNTNQPNATLDVYGSLRIGNNCVPAECDANHAWTMMYYEYFWWHIVVCAQNVLDNTEYKRYNLSMELNDDGYWHPQWYTQSCYAPVPSPHPVPHPEPYEVAEGVGTPFGGASDS